MMHYTGTKTELVWTGQAIFTQGQICLLEENEKGEPLIAIGAGKLIPENWIGKRVSVTVKLEPQG